MAIFVSFNGKFLNIFCIISRVKDPKCWQRTMSFKYILLMYANATETKAMTESERETVLRKHKILVSELTKSGELLDGAGLDYAWNTHTIQWNQNNPVSTEGPLINNQDQVTAYYVVKCEDQNRAYEIANQLLDFHVTAVEVRRIHT